MPSGTRPSHSHSTARTRMSAALVRRTGSLAFARTGGGAGDLVSAASMALSSASAPFRCRK